MLRNYGDPHHLHPYYGLHCDYYWRIKIERFNIYGGTALHVIISLTFIPCFLSAFHTDTLTLSMGPVTRAVQTGIGLVAELKAAKRERKDSETWKDEGEHARML